MVWNWHAPALWNRFTTELVRVLATDAGLSEAGCRRLVRVAYAKVAEFQARGLVHFHAIIRLDHPDDRAKAPGLRISADELAVAIRQAAERTSVQGHAGTATCSSCASATRSTPACSPTRAMVSR